MTAPTQRPPLHTLVLPDGVEIYESNGVVWNDAGWHAEAPGTDDDNSDHIGPYPTREAACAAVWEWALARECERLSVSAQQHRLPILCYSDHPFHGWANEQDGVGIDLGDQEWLIATDRQAWICVVDDWFCHSLEDLVSISHIEMQDDAAVSKWAHPEDRTMFLTLILMNIERK